MMMQPLEPVDVLGLFPDLHGELLDVLRSLSPEEWSAPTACAGWSVKDVAAHMLGDAVGLLSRKRDGFQLSANIDGWESLVAFINELNDVWVRALRRMSPRLIIDLSALLLPQVHAYFAALDPAALDEPVGWAGPEPSPNWLHTAREYTEYWLHQQHIREAVQRPGLTEARFLAPVIATFVRALPQAYRAVAAPEGTLVRVIVTRNAPGVWNMVRYGGVWKLVQQAAATPACVVTLDADTLWRMATKGISPQVAHQRAQIEGDLGLASALFEMVAILA